MQIKQFKSLKHFNTIKKKICFTSYFRFLQLKYPTSLNVVRCLHTLIVVVNVMVIQNMFVLYSPTYLEHKHTIKCCNCTKQGGGGNKQPKSLEQY